MSTLVDVPTVRGGDGGLLTQPLALAGLVALVTSGHTAKSVSPDPSGGGAYERGVRLTPGPG